MEPLTLTELWSAVVRRRRVVAVGALVGLLAGLGAHLLVPDRYGATTVVQVQDPDPARVDMTVEEAVANSRRVGDEALEALGRRSLDVEGLERAADARAVADSRVLRVSFVDPSPVAAARGADAVAQAYLAARAVDAEDEAGGGAEVGRVLDPARVPTAPRGPGLLGWAAGGLALGLLVTVPWAARPTRRTPAARAS